MNWEKIGTFGYICPGCGEECKDFVMGIPRWNYCPICGIKLDKPSEPAEGMAVKIGS